MTRRQLLDAAEISEAELTELEDYGLIRRVGRQYGRDALAVARAVAALRQYGVQARHLRAVKAAADREANLVEQVVAPQLRQRGPGARDAAARTAWQIADLTLRLHATLVESALAEAGLASGAAAQRRLRIVQRRLRAPGRRIRPGFRRRPSLRPGGCARPPDDYGCTLAKGVVAKQRFPRHVRTEL